METTWKPQNNGCLLKKNKQTNKQTKSPQAYLVNKKKKKYAVFPQNYFEYMLFKKKLYTFFKIMLSPLIRISCCCSHCYIYFFFFSTLQICLLEIGEKSLSDISSKKICIDESLIMKKLFLNKHNSKNLKYYNLSDFEINIIMRHT